MKKNTLSLFKFYFNIIFNFTFFTFFFISANASVVEKPIFTQKAELFFEKKIIRVYSNTKFKNKLTLTSSIEKGSKITWSCTSKKYFRVSSKGVVSVKKGADGKKCRIIATAKNKKGHKRKNFYTILVHRRAKKLSISAKQDFIFIGKPLRIYKTITPSNTYRKKVKWKSTSPTFATISKNGVIHAKRAGMGKYVTFTAVTADGSSLKSSLTLKIVDPKKPMVALTFDDGPKNGYTEQILHTLKKYNGHATFFVIGSNINASTKPILKKALKQGNELGNHSFSHPNLTQLSSKGIKDEINKTAQLVYNTTGIYPKLVRLPYGSFNSTVKNSISFPLIQWSIDTLDWKTKNASSTVSNVLKHVKDGSIVLMHDIHTPTVDATLQLIPALVKRGYQLCTISELAKYKGALLKSGSIYCSFP